MTDRLYMFLNRPRWTKTSIATKKEQIADLHRMMLPGAVRYDTVSVQTSPDDPMAKFAEKLFDLEEDLKKLESNYVRQYSEVEQLICKLDDKRLEEVITLRYLVGKSFEDIASTMDYAESWIYKLHREAIGELEILGGFKEDSKR